MSIEKPGAADNRRPKGKVPSERVASQGRHEAQCLICAHQEREEIEQAFVGWVSPAKIAEEHSVSRDGVYRHAHAFGLMEKRRRNVRAALERIIEKAGEVDVNAASVVGAISAYARINSRGEWVERSETVNLNDLFQRMTGLELEAYARDGTLPDWFDVRSGATPADSGGSTDVS
jgi:hypothetical protein